MVLVKKFLWAVPVAVASLVLAGCSTSGTGSRPVRATGELYPLSWVIEQVGGDRVSVDTLVPPGAEPHGYELSPQQVSALGRNDLVVYVRTLAAAVDDGVKASPPKAAIDLTTVLPTRPAVDGSTGTSGAGGIDPHLWLNPANMPKIVDAVAAQLSSVDPAGRATYTANAATLDSRLTALADDYARGLAHCSTKTLVVSHPAFGYLADQYGLTQVGASGVDEDTEPSPARLVEVEKIARADKVTTIFYADTSNQKIADVIAGALNARTASLTQLISQPSGGDYISGAQQNLTALRTGLGCS
ncbi:MAG TPA: metal ABC transporter substrate-binding protein [Propionibacteriaceae bacterium]|nr:metal ABC transporter substrate-binding protein [Propionibacteriaceae bacterium]